MSAAPEILVTGGSGGLGRQIVERLNGPRVLTNRKAAPPGCTAVKGDLVTGGGLAAACAGVAVIVHAASNHRAPERVDVGGTQQLLAAAKAAGVGHFLYVSIVGTDRVPMRYYRAKAACEAAVRSAGVPWSILRATQFHSLIDAILRPFRWLPVLPLPASLKFQPIDSAAVAEACVAAAGRAPAGMLPNLGGPEVRTLGELAQIRYGRPVLPVPYPGAGAAAIEAGALCCPDQASRTKTYADWCRSGRDR